MRGLESIAEESNQTRSMANPQQSQSSAGVPLQVWRRVMDFAGLHTDATYLWPRWLVLRAVGVIYIFVFAGIIREAQALVGPTGITPLDAFFGQLKAAEPSAFLAGLTAPSLFWLGHGAGAITVLAWAGLAAAVALVLNLWPRAALLACWAIFVSFTSTWRMFSPAQLDGLMLEVALLCVPWAPAGFRPGLGAQSPPRPLAIFMVRWLLFRVMFESGLVKLTAGDPHWRNLTAMEVMYETSPLPTVLAYWDHHLPHLWHLGEIVLTFLAELVGPVLAVFGGRRGRWWAFVFWTLFQIGIQLTSNFGWLNTASIGFGLALLDDQMLAAAATRFRRWWPARWLTPKPSAGQPARSETRLTTWGWRTVALGLWIHFAFTLFYFAKACGVKVYDVAPTAASVVRWVSGFRSVKEYSLYASFDPVRYLVEFEGSNDGGRTWRTYRYRFLPQREDEMAGFIAPWFGRFEATVQIEAWVGRKSPVLAVVAARLLAREPEVMALFQNNPFPDRPPTLLRMVGSRLTFTEVAVWRQTRRYWRKEPAGDYLPPLYRTESGGIGQFSLEEGNVACAQQDFATARDIFARQYAAGYAAAGFRLADLWLRGLGGPADQRAAYGLFSELARRGEPGADYSLGLCHEYGLGVPVDEAQAAVHYRRAAEQGNLPAMLGLGSLYAMDRVVPRDDVEGLSWLLRAEDQANRLPSDDPTARAVRERQGVLANRLKERMLPAQIEQARQRAAQGK